MKQPIYLIHVSNTTYLEVEEVVELIKESIQDIPEWKHWEAQSQRSDATNNFPAQPLFVRILNKPGPVVILGKIQQKAILELRNRLGWRCIIIQCLECDEERCFDAIKEARKRFEAKEPYLPRKYVVAILLLRKLNNGNYWGGKEKGYLWKDELAKGRGVDEKYASIIIETANDLLQHQMLIKKTSQGTTKYALNPDNKKAVHRAIESGIFEDKLERILKKDKIEVSSHELWDPKEIRNITLKAGKETHKTSSTLTAYDMATNVSLYREYIIEIEFDDGYVLTEAITEKSILIQFIEAFKL